MNKPIILVIDDEPDLSEPLRSLSDSKGQEVEIEILHPRDVRDVHLSDASVIIVDHYLDNWNELEGQISSLRPVNGIALAGIYRSQTDYRPSPPAIVLRTAKLEDLRAMIPSKSAEHLLAWQYDLEWVLPKVSLESDISELTKLISLAKAVADLRELWSNGVRATELAFGWLRLEEQSWAEVAAADVSETHPPIHSVAQRTHGVSIMRWFLHRILPYPTFLLNDRMLAIKLGVAYEWLLQELTEDSELRQELDGFRYRGAFSDFDGPRWWRAGLANFIVRATNGKPFDLSSLQEAVGFKSCTTPDFLSCSVPVLAVDPDTMQSTQVVNADQAVRIQLDGWPTFADDAWATRSDAMNEPHLAELVIDKQSLRFA